MYSKKRQAHDFLDKCRVISSVEQPNGFFVESDLNAGIVLKRGYNDNGVYQEEEIESFQFTEIVAEDPDDTVLNLKQAIQDNFGRKRFWIEESLYDFMKKIHEEGYISEEIEDTEDDISILYDDN